MDSCKATTKRTYPEYTESAADQEQKKKKSEEVADIELKETMAITLEAGATKASIRKLVWEYLEANDLALFPRPVHHRIPNHKGSEAACQKIAELEIFKESSTVKADPDKPLEHSRFLALEAKKTLIVPTPRLKTGLFNKIIPPSDADGALLKVCATKQGVTDYSEPIGLDADMQVDLAIVGSVAVSPKGWRIGKGEGFSDLENGIMWAMGAISERTKVVTIVHDCQVIEDIPEELFGPHDVCTDYIITPTRVIECPERPQANPGIIWSLLGPKKLERMPILKELREKEEKLGNDVTLKEEEEPSGEDDGEEANRRKGWRRQHFSRECSVYVGSLPRGLRVSEFKLQIRGRNVNPLKISWFGATGHAFLQFESPVEAKSAIDILQGMEIEGREIKVAVSERKKPREREEAGDSGKGESADTEDKEEGSDEKSSPNEKSKSPRRQANRRKRFSGGSRRPDPEKSVYVGNIPRQLRVSEFKTIIRESNVMPLKVVWNGVSGHAFLHFVTDEEAKAAIDALEGMELDGRELKVEKARQRQARRSTEQRGTGDEAAEESGKERHSDEETHDQANTEPEVQQENGNAEVTS